MNEVLDPKLSAEEKKAVENSLPETPEQEEVENVISESESLPEEITTPEEVNDVVPEEALPEGPAEEPATEPLPEEPVAEPTVETVEDVVTESIEQPALEEEAAELIEQPAVEEKAEPIQQIAAEEVASEEAVPVAEPEEAPATAVETPEVTAPAEATTELIDKLTREEIVERLQSLVEGDVETVRNEVDSLKQAYYKLRKNEVEEAKKAYMEAGGVEADFQAPIDETETKLKELLTGFRDKKALLLEEEDKQKEANLAEKKAILEELKTLIDSQDDFNKIYNEFRRLQQRWKEIKLVPQSQVNDLWKEYQHYSEKFYDLLKINNEMRIYDFKKNLELKTTLIEAVEKLDAEQDVVSAFHQLQKFHQEWREIGPVTKELREDIWTRFKEASSVINKKHQAFFETLRAGEQQNLDEKTAICEEIEKINYDELTTFKDWDERNQQVLDLQHKWKTIGFAPKKFNVKIFERFRAACDVFFQKKSEFYKSVKENMDSNLEKKKALCVQAEALKDSTDWKETTEKMIALQKEWKTIGTVSRKHSDAVWTRFIAACDYFFEQKNKNFADQKSEELENLRLKKEVIEKIKSIDESLPAEETLVLIRDLMGEWNNIGYVPFRDKDKLYKEYRSVVDNHFDRLKIDHAERRLQSFRTNLSEIAGGEKPKGKLLSEREKLMRTFEKLKSDIQTYENNIGFLSVSSKGGGGLVKEMNRKIEDLKTELDLIVKKIQAIDENLEA